MADQDTWDEKGDAYILKKSIEEIIEALNKHHKNVNISRVAGSSVAIATGAIVLGVASGVSGAVSVGASITGHFLKKSNVDEVQVKWDKFRLKFLARHKVQDVIDMNVGESERAVEGVGAVGSVARTAGGVTGAIIRGVKAASTAAKVASPILVAAGFIALPLDLFDLISAAKSLDKDEPSSASESLQSIIDFLDRVINGEFDE